MESLLSCAIAKQIHDAGFRDIVLATGRPEESEKKCPWIAKVINKTPPWLKMSGFYETSA
jgi:hypothetical protein